MMIYAIFFIVLLILYYSQLNYVVRSLLLLEFMSFYVLTLFGLMGYSSLVGQFFIMLVFLVFVLEGVVGIISMILYTNYSGSSMMMLSSLK